MGKKVGQVRVRLTKTPVHRGPLIVTSPEPKIPYLAPDPKMVAALLSLQMDLELMRQSLRPFIRLTAGR